MNNSRNLVVGLCSSELNTVLKFPEATKKNLCISANLSAETKELEFVTGDGKSYTVSTSVFKSTDKTDVQWDKFALSQLGNYITFGNASFKVQSLIEGNASKEVSQTASN